MFEPSDTPRVFATPLGVDFCAALLGGLTARLEGQPPEALARVELFVSNDRLRRRLLALLGQRGPGFLPKITPLARISARPELIGLPAAMSPLRLRLELTRLIQALLDREPELASRHALYDLADSLATLIGEMQEEGVTPQALAELDLGDHAEHWRHAREFLKIVAKFFAPGTDRMTEEARLTAAVARLEREWQERPPEHPVIVAGSTGSRGVTARLMRVVASLPQGAVVLPGLDTDLPPEIWESLLEDRRRELAGEDHPQFRFGRLTASLGLDPSALPRWSGDAPVAPGRNAWLSLSLMPAPVTDRWRLMAPGLPDPGTAFADVTLLEAPDPQTEALAIALRLREAAETGETAALVTPDRTLSRRVTAALDRWNIVPDDSAGKALDTTPSGRLLAMLAEIRAKGVDSADLLAVMKHPLCNSAGDDRGAHLGRTRALEIERLRGGPPHPTASLIADWAGARAEKRGDAEAPGWAAWVAETVLSASGTGTMPLSDHIAAHLALAEAVAAGPGAEPGASGRLWEAGEDAETRARMQAVAADADAGGEMTAAEYRDLIRGILSDAETRNPVRPHARIMIWGALEARVQGADLMILGGLNEGTWPAPHAADPWASRDMRAQAGLRLPDQRTGLSAHDYQQAAAAKSVWLTRARKDAETETVPARWLNRLTNLLEGSGPASRSALEAMRARGVQWAALAHTLATPEPGLRERDPSLSPAPRPSPAPPVTKRPRNLSVTQIETLLRDPFAIYARNVLRLRPLEPLRPRADYRLRGTALHHVLQRFTEATRAGIPAKADGLLMETAREVLGAEVPWPVARQLWLSGLARAASRFLRGEALRRSIAEPWLLEEKRTLQFDDLAFSLTAKPDRIDRTEDGRLVIYDYKAGSPPSSKQEQAFNKQLLLEGMMAARGAFTDGHPAEIAGGAYLSILKPELVVPVELDRAVAAQTEEEFRKLISAFREPERGYTSRRAMFDSKAEGDYDHLARFGEWDVSDAAKPQKVGT